MLKNLNTHHLEIIQNKVCFWKISKCYIKNAYTKSEDNIVSDSTIVVEFFVKIQKWGLLGKEVF